MLFQSIFEEAIVGKQRKKAYNFGSYSWKSQCLRLILVCFDPFVGGVHFSFRGMFLNVLESLSLPQVAIPNKLIAMGPNIGEVANLHDQGVVVLNGLVLGRYCKDLKKILVSVVPMQ